jgi:glycine/D-amino acid oxidase-like deaminating enzyme
VVEAKGGRIAARPVVIAADHNSAELPGQINHLVGIRAVANDIAEIPDRVIVWRSRKNRFESRQIGMNVGNDKRAHAGFTFVFWLSFRL